MLTNTEAEPSKIIQAFDNLLEAQFNHQKTLLAGEAESYPRYRALYATIEKEKALEDQPVSEDEINSLASHLLADEIYSGSLK